MPVSRRRSALLRILRSSIDVSTSLRMSAGAILLRTGSYTVLVHRTATRCPNGVLQLYIDTICVCVCRIPPDWSAVLSHIVAEG